MWCVFHNYQTVDGLVNLFAVLSFCHNLTATSKSVHNCRVAVERTADDLLRAWCAAFEARDPDAQVALLADDAVLLAPYAPEGVPPRVDGKDNIAPLMHFVGSLFSAYRFTALDVHATDEPGLAFGTAHAEITLKNGDPYTQDLVFLVRARGGQIVEYTEYLDPIRAQTALGAAA